LRKDLASTCVKLTHKIAIVAMKLNVLKAVAYNVLSRPSGSPTSCLFNSFSSSGSMATSFYDLSDKDMTGDIVPMSKFKGKVLCLVNVASACGYTQSNYGQLSKLYDDFQDKIEILAFPCNQFGAQEPVRLILVHKSIAWFSRLYSR
jgi:Glutathione peroxidase